MVCHTLVSHFAWFARIAERSRAFNGSHKAQQDGLSSAKTSPYGTPSIAVLVV